MKKLVTLFLSVMMLATCCFGLTAEASVNVYPEGNFEAWTDGVPDGWTTIGTDQTSDGAVFTKLDVSTDTTCESDSAIQITKASGHSGSMVYVLAFAIDREHRSVLVPGATYKVSFKFKRASGGGTNLFLVGSSSYNEWSRSGAFDDEIEHQVQLWSSWDKSEGTGWNIVEKEFKVSKYCEYAWLSFQSSNAVSTFTITDFKVEGVKRPAFASPVVKGNNVITNGGFAENSTEGWALSEGVTVTEGAVSVTGNQTATYTLPYLGESPAKIYEIEVDVMTAATVTAAAGAPKVSIDTYVGGVPEANKELRKGFYFDRLVDVDLTFVPLKGNGEWEKIIFNWSPPTLYDDTYAIKLTFSSAVNDVALTYDNLSMRSTNNLFANGSFEGLPIANAVAEGLEESKSQIGGVFGLQGANGANIANQYKANNLADFTIGTGNYILNLPKASSHYGELYAFGLHQMRFESGKSYKVFAKMKPAGHNDANIEQTHMAFYLQTLVSESNAADISSTAWNSTNKWLGGVFKRQQAVDSNFISIPTTVVDSKTGNTLPWNTKTSKMCLYGPTGSPDFYLDDIEVVEYEEGVKFYTEDAQKITSIVQAKGKNVVAYYLSDKLPTDKKLSFVLALYKMNGDIPMLVDVTVNEDTNSLRAPIHNLINIPDDVGNYKLSAFCLDSVTGLKALEEKVDLN